MKAISTIVIALTGVLLFANQVRGQVATGTILGNVTDTSGAAVPGATVTATADAASVVPG